MYRRTGEPRRTGSCRHFGRVALVSTLRIKNQACIRRSTALCGGVSFLMVVWFMFAQSVASRPFKP